MLDVSADKNLIPAWVNGELMPVDKLDAHKRGLRHKAISVFVMRGDEMLLQQRAAVKYHTPGLWTNTCCTHPLWDEDSTTCAVRRLDEELGITGLTPVFRGHVEYRADVGNGLIEHEAVDIFTADATPDMPLAPNSDEVSAIRWITLSALEAESTDHPDRFTPWLRIYLRDYADVIFGD